MNTTWIIGGVLVFVLVCWLTARMIIRDRRFRIVNKALAEAYNELTEANAHIREHAERKSAFLASMSHELRTPITAIKGYVDNMCDGFSGDLTEKQRHSLTRVSQNTGHLLNLIDNLLDLSKMEVGRMNVNASRFALEPLIAYCVSMAQGLAKTGVTVHYDIAPGIENMFTDEMRLRQILINLLGNAVKFTEVGVVRVKVRQRQEMGKGTYPQPLPEGRGVRSKTGESQMRPLEMGDGGRMVEISVSDTGTGIAESERETIFDEYRQVRGADRSVQKGTGLGLSITRKFVELLGGSIAVESEVGKGSVFRVCIPMGYGQDVR